jgi:ubiquinone/menaquinone biosynthesis C-methylase UbiE
VPEEMSLESAANMEHFRTPVAVSDLSVYRLLREEEYLFGKYYKAGESVLDLACGMGRTTLLLYELGLKVRGVDRSDIFIEVAKRRLPYLDLQVGSYDGIDEEDSSYSHVLISFNGIDSAVPEAQRVVALRECARVLKPGGTFIYSSHNLKSLHWFSPYYRDRIKWKMRNHLKAFKNRSYVYEHGEYLLYTSPEYVLQQTEEAGLELREMVGFSRFKNQRIDIYFSPYIHYVFVKPLK